jgi:hypothetical protein
MKIYLVCLLVFASWSGVAIPGEGAIAQSKPPTATKGSNTTKVISPTAALERLITAKQLQSSWFTPTVLKEADLGKLQFQRDMSLKLGRMRYGNYKSVQSIGGDKYRVIFDRAEPDTVILQMKLDANGRIAGIGITEKNKPTTSPQALARSQVNAKAAVDRAFKTNTDSKGQPSQIIVNLKQWMGKYQKTEAAGGSYSAIFDRGSVPIKVDSNDNGSVKAFGMGCPVVPKSMSLSQAPPDLQKLLSTCPNLK